MRLKMMDNIGKRSSILRHNKTLSVALVVLWGVCIASISKPPLLAQPSTVERPRLKDFGSSLKRKSNKKKGEPEKKEAGRAKEADDEVIRVETDLVSSDVLVLDQRGNAVLGLSQKDFIVTEDDMPQEVALFALGSDTVIPRSIALVIDYSGSLAPYIDTSVEAGKLLVDKLGPRDRMAIVTDDVKLLVDFTSDKTILKGKLESLKGAAKKGDAKRGWAAGHSLQFSALMATLRELFDGEDIRPLIIFQTDGDELRIMNTLGQTYKFTLEDVYRAAEESHATIYPIIPGRRFIGLPEDEQVKIMKMLYDEKAAHGGNKGLSKLPESKLRETAKALEREQSVLANLAKLTGGYADFLESPEQADFIYSRIFSGIKKRYLIGYYPSNKARDGKHRRVNIAVRDHPEYVVWGRKGYFAAQPEQ